jgi:hypothetical protein
MNSRILDRGKGGLLGQNQVKLIIAARRLITAV